MNTKNEIYYEIIKSWWEVFSNGKKYRVSSIVRIKSRMPFFRYETYEDAHEEAVIIRKMDPTYRYDLGDRIYVKKTRRKT